MKSFFMNFLLTLLVIIVAFAVIAIIEVNPTRGELFIIGLMVVHMVTKR